ncbi:cobalamin biosynthesis protein, partial [Mycobacterium sp.]|uniref:cobalamin biosynthesis protein n=1 Tax=Mycobacterium sp. TaxID=1785 RepID=UPI003C736095
MFGTTGRSRVVGVLAGYVADMLLADPRAGHPVAGFGAAAAAMERLTYRDTRIGGAAHVGVLVGGVGLLGAAAQLAARRRGPLWSIAATAVATWIALG